MGDSTPPDGGTAVDVPDASVPVVDAGTPVDAGAPVNPALPIASPAPLTEAQCRWELPAGTCPNGEGCLLLHRRGQPATPVLTQEQLGHDTFHFVPMVTDDHFFFTTFRSVFSPAGPPRLLAMPALGGPLTDLLDLTEEHRINSVEGPAESPGYAVWFVAEVDRGDERNRTLSLFQGNGLANGAYPGIPSAVVPAVAVATDYFVAHEDGVYSYYPAGGGRLVEATGVSALTADEQNVVWAQCTQNTCSVRRYQRRAGEESTVMTGVAGYIQSLAVVGTHVYALTGRALVRAPLTGGAAETVYRGNALPQHPGTLRPDSLRADGNRLFLDQACHLDADAPEFGTVEVDVTARQARWLNLDPAFPFHRQTRAREGWSSLWANRSGIYTWQHN